MSEHEQLMLMVIELKHSMESLKEDIKELRLGVRTPVSRNHNTQTKWLCPDGHVSSGTKYQMYCASKGLDSWLAVRII